MIKSLGISQKYIFGVFVQEAAPQDGPGRKVPRSPRSTASRFQGTREAYCRGGEGISCPKRDGDRRGATCRATPRPCPLFSQHLCRGKLRGEAGEHPRGGAPRISFPRRARPLSSGRRLPHRRWRSGAHRRVPSPRPRGSRRAAEGRHEPSEPALKGGRPRPGLQLLSSPRSGSRAAPQRAGAS